MGNISYTDFINKFQNVKITGEKTAKCSCPCHQDNDPSLSISEVNGQILLHCFAGCQTEDILKSIGLCYSDILSGTEIEEEKIYKYFDENANYLYEKVKFKNGNTYYRVFNSANGEYTYNLKGIEKVPYNLSTLINTVRNNEAIYIVEGEKDVETLRAYGIPATTAGGPSEWKNSFSKYFVDANVIILPDNDEQGIKLAEKIEHDLKPVASSIKIVQTSTAKNGDISDFFESGNSKEDFYRLIDEYKPCSSNKPKKISAKQLEISDIKPVEMICRDLIPKGITIIGGAPKVGKSWFVLQLATAVATGSPFLGYETSMQKVLYFALEDTEARLKSRLLEINNDKDAFPENLDFYLEAPLLKDGLISILEDEVKTGVELIIIDTLQKIRGYDSRKNVYAADYNFIDPLKSFATKHNVGIILVHHTRKEPSKYANTTVNGTHGITGSADSILVISKDKQDDKTAFLSVSGREIESNTFRIEFEDCNWRFVETKAETEQKEKLKSYENSPVINTIKDLLSGSSAWTGSASDIQAEMQKRNYPSLEIRQIGKTIRKFENELYEYDNITYKQSANTANREYCFICHDTDKTNFNNYLPDDLPMDLCFYNNEPKQIDNK